MASALDQVIASIDEMRGQVAEIKKHQLIQANSRKELDESVRKALGAGGKSWGNGGHQFATAFGEGGGAMDGLGSDNAMSSLAEVYNLYQPRRKGLGGRFQEFLQLVHAGCGRPGGGGLVHSSPDSVNKALRSMGSQVVSKTALAESAGFTGGYTVPTEFYAQLLRYMAEDSFVRQRCTTVPMTTAEMLVPALTQANSAAATGASNFFSNIVFQWIPEGGTIQESEPTFRQVHLVARTLIIYSVASVQILQDNAVALDAMLTTLFAEATAWLYDWYILNGTGVNQPLGVLGAGGSGCPAAISQTRVASNAIGFTDINKMMSRFFTGGYKQGIWVTSPSCLPQILALADSTNGRLVWLNQFPAQNAEAGGPVAQRIPATIYGMPLYISEKVPTLGTTGDIMLIDPSKMLVGDRLTIQIEASPYPRFTNYQMVWRAALRWDAQPWPSNPIKLANGDSVSSFVLLDSATS